MYSQVAIVTGDDVIEMVVSVVPVRTLCRPDRRP